MSKILIGFSTSSDLDSQVIEKITSAKVSHAFFLIESEWGQLVYQADSRGPVLELAEFGLALENRKVVATFDPKVDLTAALKESIKRYTGYSYDWEADICAGLNDLAKKAGLKWRTAFSGAHASMCSALVVRTLRLEPTYPEVYTLSPELTEPGELFDYCLRLYQSN
jgi:hypothetical protein